MLIVYGTISHRIPVHPQSTPISYVTSEIDQGQSSPTKTWGGRIALGNLTLNIPSGND